MLRTYALRLALHFFAQFRSGQRHAQPSDARARLPILHRLRLHPRRAFCKGCCTLCLKINRGFWGYRLEVKGVVELECSNRCKRCGRRGEILQVSCQAAVIVPLPYREKPDFRCVRRSKADVSKGCRHDFRHTLLHAQRTSRLIYRNSVNFLEPRKPNLREGEDTAISGQETAVSGMPPKTWKILPLRRAAGCSGRWYWQSTRTEWPALLRL